MIEKTRDKIKADYRSKEIYNFYCKTTGNPRNITQHQFVTVMKDFFSVVIHRMIYDNFELTFPRRLGNLRIEKAKMEYKLNEKGQLDKRALSPNYKACKELWAKMYPGVSPIGIKNVHPDRPLIYYENKHTDGFRHKWKWDKRTCLVRHGALYKLDIARANDRMLASALKNPNLMLDFYTYRKKQF